MRHPMMSVLEQNPVLPAVKDAGRLEACLAQPAGVVFLLCGDILNIDRLIDRVHQAGKYAVVHADLVAGLAPREIAVDFLHRCGADGIISTRQSFIRRAKELGLAAILRVFLLDSISLESLGKMPANLPDCLDILPGTMPKILRRVCADAKVPVLTGGLIADKEDVMAALDAGAMDVLVADTPAKIKDAWAARSSFLEAIMHETKLLDECDVVVPVNKIADYMEDNHTHF